MDHERTGSGGRQSKPTDRAIGGRARTGKTVALHLAEERDAERAEKEKTRAQAAGTSFFQRRKIWKEERKRVGELRSTKAAEIGELRRKEHEDENKLGPGDPPVDSGKK